jgi:hypothetical protein
MHPTAGCAQDVRPQNGALNASYGWLRAGRVTAERCIKCTLRLAARRACDRRTVHQMYPTAGCAQDVRPQNGALNAPYGWLRAGRATAERCIECTLRLAAGRTCDRRTVHQMHPTAGCGQGVRPQNGALNAPYGYWQVSNRLKPGRLNAISRLFAQNSSSAIYKKSSPP